MPFLKDHLNRMRTFAEASPFSPFPHADHAEELLKPLNSAVERMLARSGGSAVFRPDTLLAARQKWSQISSLTELSSREIRVLCNDPETATKPEFIVALESRGDLSRQRAWLEGLIGQYFSAWGHIFQPDTIERLLQAAVTDFADHSRRISQCKPFCAQLFSNSAARWIGLQFLEATASIPEVLSVWGIDSESSLGRAGVNSAVEVWALYMEQSGTRLPANEVEVRIQYLTGILLESNYVDAAEAGKAISALAMLPVLERDSDLLTGVRDYVMSSSRFGDPRLPVNVGRWGFCSRDARDRVASWFSKRDLEFFFDHAIPKRDDPHGRRVFWKKYLHQVKDCVVLLSEDDERRLRAHNTERLEHGRTQGAAGVSAFVMQFQNADGLIVVEFSKSGNALYIHDSKKFFAHIGGSLRSRALFHVAKDLKSPISLWDTQSHFEGWTHIVANFLRTKGIRPHEAPTSPNR